MHVFDYEPDTATTAAHAALDCWTREGGFLVRYPSRSGSGTLVVTDDLDDCQVMVPTRAGWAWVDDIIGHEASIHTALRDVGASEPSIEEMIGGAMSCADWLEDRRGTVPRIIGTRTVYFGDEHRSVRGRPVEIVAVLKGGAAPGADSCTARLTDDRAIAEAGGVTEHDRLEARTAGTSFVTIDPRAVDTDRFAHLAR